MFNKVFTFILMLVALVVIPVVISASEIISIDKAVKIALKNNEDILMADQDLKNANHQYWEAFSNALPKIDASFTGVKKLDSTNEFIDQSEDYSLQGEITLAQPIWVGGKVGTGIKIASIYKDLTKKTFQLEQEKKKLEIKQSFYNVLLARKALEVIHLVKQDADENLANLEIMFSQGLISEYDIVKARVRVKEVEPQLVQYENQLKLAEDKLKSDLVIDFDVDVEFAGSINDEAYKSLLDIQDYKKKALEQRLELKILELQNEMYKNNKRIVQGDFLPTLSAVGVYSIQGTNDYYDKVLENDFSYKNINVGLNLQVPIFNGGGTLAKVKQADVSIKKAKLQLIQTKRLIELEAESNHKSMIRYAREIELHKQSVEEADKALDIANVRYVNGVGTQIEVVDAQSNLEQAKLQELSAIHNFINSSLMFKLSIGDYK